MSITGERLAVILALGLISGICRPVWGANGATFVSQAVGTTMTAGSTQIVSVTMHNSGDTAWTQALEYKLGSENPRDNTIWLGSTNRVTLESGETISPGQDKVFAFTITAPTEPGNYNFQWRMLRELVEWFGEYTTNVVITVNPAPTATPTFTPTRTRTPTATRSSTRTSSPTPTISATRTPSRTATPTRTLTASPTITPTATASPTITPTCTLTGTPAAIIPTRTATAYVTITPMVLRGGEVVAYPSPANGGFLWFYYRLDNSARVEIEIFNVLGEKIAVLNDTKSGTGYNRIAWNIENIAAGVYLYRMKTEGTSGRHVSTLKRLVIVKMNNARSA